MAKVGEFNADLVEGRNQPEKVHSNISVNLPQTHHLPWFVMWSCALAIPILTAMTNFAMVQIDVHLIVFKYDDVMQRVMSSTYDPVMGALALAGICVVYTLVNACLVSFLAPGVAGSGIPECKGYLNGNNMPGLFTFKAFFARTLGVVLTTAAGFPVGREGPMVGIGGYIGYAVTHFLAQPYMSKWVKSDQGDDGSLASPTLVVHKERFAYAKRIGTVMGSTCGIATAFNAPIGGILYLFEEVTVTNWAPELTFKVFVASVLATITTKGLMFFAGADVHRLLIYEDGAGSAGSYYAIDIVVIGLQSVLIGALAAAFGKALAACWSIRTRIAKRLSRFQPWAKIAEAVFYAFFCAMVFGLLPSLAACEPTSSFAGDDHHRRLGGLVHSAYTCEEGHHNRMATLLLSGAEGAVKHLFARGPEAVQDLGHLAICLVVYFCLACGMSGLPVPMGVFVPSMLIGAFSGRFVGEAMQMFGKEFDMEVASAGIYAMCGSAAMLGGFTHMSLAIVALLVEAAHDLSLVPTLMLAVSVATLVSKKVSHHAYDEVLIMRKGVPFLEPEVPHELDHDGLIAADLMDELPDEAILPRRAKLEMVNLALSQQDVSVFPVFDDGACIGTVDRARLEAASEAHANVTAPADDLDWGTCDQESSTEKLARASVTDKELGVNNLVKKLCRRPSQLVGDQIFVPLYRLMDPVPHTIMEELPAAILYPIFAHGIVSSAVVLSKKGDFRGLLSRRNLISKSGRKAMPPFLDSQSDGGSVARSRAGTDMTDPAGSQQGPSRNDSEVAISAEEL